MIFRMFFPILFFISSSRLDKTCSDSQKYELAKSAEKCFQKFFSHLDLSSSCGETACEASLASCHEPDYMAAMAKFFREKAIYYKWWLELSNRLLSHPLSESVFYFFSPFLLFAGRSPPVAASASTSSPCTAAAAATKASASLSSSDGY